MTQPRGVAREVTILDVVLELLNDGGYDRLTVDAVAARAHASKATIYSRWPDKASLVAAALNRRSRNQVPPSAPANDLREDLLRFVALCATLAEGERLTTFVGILVASEDEPSLAEAVHGSALTPRHEECRGIAERAIERGELADAAAALEIFESVLGRILVRYVIERGALSDAEQETFVDEWLLPALVRRYGPSCVPSGRGRVRHG